MIKTCITTRINSSSFTADWICVKLNKQLVYQTCRWSDNNTLIVRSFVKPINSYSFYKTLIAVRLTHKDNMIWSLVHRNNNNIIVTIWINNLQSLKTEFGRSIKQFFHLWRFIRDLSFLNYSEELFISTTPLVHTLV